ncbi:MAG: hypothetical protein KBS94_01410 [Prevotella sp.]|nr:hypothetical protein [Candidatus Equicola faecalis]
MDVAHLENVRLYTQLGEDFRSPLSFMLFHLHYSRLVNRFISKPFANYIYKRQYQPSFPNNKPLCIIFLCDKPDIYNNEKYINILKQKNKGIKLVLYIVDIIDSNKNLDIKYAKDTFDMVISYDANDAKKYGLFYYPTPHSNLHPDDDDTLMSDVYFCGKAKSKERLTKILRIFELCKEQGLKCDFYITEVANNDIVYPDEIKYNKQVSFMENCRHIIKTRAILEILQDNALGFTPRLWDSIIHEKYLITDNKYLTDSNFYKPEGMFLLESNDIKKWEIASFKEKLFTPLKYSEDFKAQISPLNFIKFLETSLI